MTAGWQKPPAVGFDPQGDIYEHETICTGGFCRPDYTGRGLSDFALLRPDVFWRADVVYLLFIQSIESIILGWGMSFGMISGNMDLSVAAETILGTIVAAIAAKSFGIPGLVVGALATTMVVGWLKSLVLRVIRTNSLVISIAYCLLLGALGAVVAQNKSLVITSAQTILGKAPWNILIAVGLGALMFYLHKYSVFGSNCRAVGGDAQLAKMQVLTNIRCTERDSLSPRFTPVFPQLSR